MNYHWLRDRENQKQFNLTWDKGTNNDADYHTKHHPPKHHLQQQNKYVFVPNCDISKVNFLNVA